MTQLSDYFSDLLVIETATILAGPSVGMFLAELGATVIKVENKKIGGDGTRQWRLPTEDQKSDICAYFSCVNWGKKSLALDLSDVDDLNILHRLLGQADIWLHNFRPSVQARLGLTFDELKLANPKLIVAQITAYQSGDNRPGFDAMMQAETGFMYINGEPDGQPTKMPVALIDVLAAHQLKQAILLALMQRNLTGEGSELAASLFKTGVTSLVNQATNYLVGDVIPVRRGSDHPSISPYGSTYRTADGADILLAVGSDRQFQALCQVIDAPQLASDNRFQTNGRRVDHNEPLKALLAPLIAQFNQDDLLGRLSAAGVPAGAVRRMNDVFADPLAQEMLHHGQINDEGREIRGVYTISFNLPDGRPPQALEPPPHCDQHRAEILQKWCR